MNFEQIKYHVVDSAAIITLNRPESLNALTVKMMGELQEAVKLADADPAVRSMVFTGEGRAFCAGLDLKEMQDRNVDAGYVGAVVDKPALKLIDALKQSPKPAIGKINGFCFTGALELALTFDILYVAEEAKLGDTHAKWGLRPTWGMSARLPAAVGIRKARELSFTARTFTGKEAAQWGLANRAVPLAELDAAVKELTDGIAATSAGAVAAFKDLYDHWLTGSVDDALKYEVNTEYEISDTADRLGGFD
ncbi:MAG: enoyl-CoA hydratase/isomerase family protein [Sphingomonadales bacterium]|jgi:enoyl-CoA hydratase|nr:enoyl-CoA hydratase/isomerase family protein [Sphingomonadales bacterium]